MNDVQLTLWAAQMLISDPKDWTQGTFAYAADGASVPSDDPRACRWCAMGAVYAVQPDLPTAMLARAALGDKCNDYDLTEYNDTHSHRSVMAVFDKAIEAAA